MLTDYGALLKDIFPRSEADVIANFVRKKKRPCIDTLTLVSLFCLSSKHQQWTQRNSVSLAVPLFHRALFSLITK